MIPFLDLAAEYRELKAEIDTAVTRVLESGHYVLGSEVESFEQEFARYSGVQHAVSVNSGTSALHLALLAAGVEPGDEVITTPFTFYATVAAIHYVGATPVYVDIDPATLNIDADRLKAAVTEKTRAILPVHLYGQPADMDPIVAVARRHKLVVIEDAAQAHGAEYQGQRVGGIGDLGCFSFYPTKNLGAAGEGGMVTANSPDYARKLRLLRNWGEERRYHPVIKAYNYRLPALQAAILRVKLQRLEHWIEIRRRLAAEYDRLLEDSSITCPVSVAHTRHVYCLYTIRSEHREELQRELTAAGIQTAIHYPEPIHLMPAYADARYKAGDLPFAEAAARTVLSIPLYPQMPPEHVQQVTAEISKHSPRTTQEPILIRR